MAQCDQIHLPHLRPLPPTPVEVRRHGRAVALKATQRRLQAASQSVTPQLQARMEDLGLLLEENRRLRMENAHAQKLQSASRKLIEHIRYISERLQQAVLEFRNEQKRIDHEYLQETAI
ncbi:hypothetical protein ACJ73_03567 [Blastomyces percursus]|uniref:Uncharacterized protein n=1 Tax=Blastomyces percursus TaxID=1658174 RepID=A0A1J9QXY8_9EURO|nr:hypothetical protein ACJ73_03567 [Blastomyces percursus]